MPVLRALAALALLSISGCSGKAPAEAANDASRDGPSASAPPPIHLSQTGIMTEVGRPKEQEAYRTSLQNCPQSGLPVHALTPAEVEKIGRIHLETWIDADRSSRHQEEWHYHMSAPCQFLLTHSDQTEIVDAKGRSTAIDNVTHEVTVEELGEPAPVTPVGPEDGEVTEGHRKAGWSKQGIAHSNGAECAIWQDSTGYQICIWTGGRQWGYSANGVDVLKDGVSPGNAIALWAHPGRYVSWKLETSEFSVGKALDAQAFAIPGGSTRTTLH